MSPDLPWLAGPWQRAAEALAAGRLPAGLLILGQPGLGRGRLAQAIAAARLCAHATSAGGACGECRDCRQVAARTHPDLFHVSPEEKGKALRVEQIRELGRALSLTSGRQGARCAIIAPADRLTAAAANSLLKTLEEPPAGVTLILVSASAGVLPPTVVSRCLRLPVPAPEREEALTWLRAEDTRPDWDTLLALAGGALLAARDLAADAWAGAPQETVQALVDAAAGKSDPVAVAGACAEWPPERLAALIAWLARGGLSLRTAGTEAGTSWPAALAALATRGDPRELVLLWRAARELAADSRFVNPALARERLILLFVNAFRPPPGYREG